VTEGNRIRDALATLRQTADSFDGTAPDLAANLRWYADDFERRREIRSEDPRVSEIRQRVALHLSERNEAWTKLVRVRAVLDECADGDGCRCPVRIRAILDHAPPADESCPDGECNQGMCAGPPEPCGGSRGGA
jgi:hypothetical protein